MGMGMRGISNEIPRMCMESAMKSLLQTSVSMSSRDLAMELLPLIFSFFRFLFLFALG